MLRIAICDDEKTQRKRLREITEAYVELQGRRCEIQEFESGEALLMELSGKGTQYDLVFLDIEMKALNGIDTARELRTYSTESILIFVTGFTDYVFQGYEVRALNYILKPYDGEKIRAVLKQALALLQKEQEPFYVVTNGGGTYKVRFRDIFYFQSDRRKIRLCAKGGAYEFYGKLDEIQEMLPDSFVRVHQRYLVNMALAEGMEGMQLLMGGEKIPVSRQRQQETMIAFAKSMLG